MKICEIVREWKKMSKTNMKRNLKDQLLKENMEKEGK
jgi:hypothetical protein